MSKSRRKVTVDTAKSVSDESEKRKPSVFERLGPGGGQRKYEYEPERMDKTAYVDKCRNWLLTRACPFGSKCKFLHGPFSEETNGPENRSRSSKRHESDNTDDIKLKLKSHRDKGSDRKRKTENSSTEKRSHSKIKHEKEGKIKSTVVVKKPVDPESEIDSEEPEEWSEDDSLKNLDFKEELTLVRKRQELQRALSNLPAPPEEQRENLTIEKKIHRHMLSGEHSVRVTSSESGSLRSSPEPSKQHSKKNMKPCLNPSSKKKEKKKHKTSKSPLNKIKSSQSSIEQLSKEKKIQLGEERERDRDRDRDVHHKIRMKKKKHKESLSETETKSPELESLRGHKVPTPLFDSVSSKSKRVLSPKHDWQKELKPLRPLDDGDGYSVSSKKSRHSRSPSIGEKSRHKKSLSPALEKRSKRSPLAGVSQERDSIIEKLSMRKRSRTRGITPDKLPSLPLSKDRSLSSDDDRSAHSSLHEGEKRKSKKGRLPERVHVSRGKLSKSDRAMYPESSGSRQSEWRNESPPRERRDRRNRDFTPERAIKTVSSSSSRDHDKLERDPKLSKKKESSSSSSSGNNKSLDSAEGRTDRKRQFKEEKLIPVCNPEVQDQQNFVKSRRLLPEHTESTINPSRRGLSPKESYGSCHSRSPSRQRRETREQSPFEVMQMRRKDINDDYRHEEHTTPDSPGRSRLLPNNNYFPENCDYSPGRQMMERGERFMDYRSDTRVDNRYPQPADRYAFDERRRYNEEPVGTVYDDRSHYDSSRGRSSRDLYERERYERVPQPGRPDPRYEEAKDPLGYDRGLPPEFRDPTSELWEIRGRGRGRVNPRSRGRQADAGGHRGRGYVPPPEDRLPGLGRDKFSIPAERPSRRSEWERHRDDYFGPEPPEWSDHRNERSLPGHDDPRQELHDIPDMRRTRRPDGRDDWRNGRRDAEELYDRRPELGTGLLMTPDRIDMRTDRWESRQPGEGPRRPELRKDEPKLEDRLDKHNVSPGEKERLDRRKRPRDQEPDQARSRSPSLKHHRDTSPVESFHSHSSVGEHRPDPPVNREWIHNRWPPNQNDLLREKEGPLPDGSPWPGARQRSPLPKHILDKKRGKEWDPGRGMREKEFLDKEADRLKVKDPEKPKDVDNPLLYDDVKGLMMRKLRPKKKEKRKRSSSKSPSLDGKDKKRVCHGVSPKAASHDEKDKPSAQPSQNQELTFSDWSDDESADDILNRPEEPQQEPVIPIIEPHIKEDRFKRSPGRGGFIPQPIRQMHNPKEEYRMWQPHKERNSRYHWEKPNLSTMPRLPLNRTLLDRHHKEISDICFRMKPELLPRLLPDPEPMSDFRPQPDSSNHGNLVDIMPNVIKQPLLGDAPGCVPLHSLVAMSMAGPPMNSPLLSGILPHNSLSQPNMNNLPPLSLSLPSCLPNPPMSINMHPMHNMAANMNFAPPLPNPPNPVATPAPRQNSDISSVLTSDGIDLDTESMQYEEISSEEESMTGDLDLDLLGVGGDKKKKKKSIVDVLNIDWSHMMQTNRPKPTEQLGSALQGFRPGRIFSKIGVSRQFAGDFIFIKLQDICNKHLREIKETNEQGKDQPNENSTTENSTNENSTNENSTKDTNPPEVDQFKFRNHIAALHMASVKKNKDRSNLLHDIGSHRRALCARRDLEIRRQLCQIDKNVEQPSLYPTQIFDSDLCKLSVQLFKQGHDSNGRKDNLMLKEVTCSS
ncbi:zinc finger CCCH domain-containing protein 13 isoform X2 [Octopus sinensis]|uniref:Zinc finger CCCH domain-containing protein 13 isoform X2 n=1 Tax=Octopus sinensis TaxID=2607531 RepID=A0A7E6FJ06_9MOLL|nr:zinc finger CCCH domain-containing protein 13 isoform X2 [Octopus sinensis]